jgi:D-glycero-D-manno-heptose 1,7-bisphosphate phosphatase
MVLDAAVAHQIQLQRSWMIGDRDTDIECGRRAELQTIRVEPDHLQTGQSKLTPVLDRDASDLLTAVQLILDRDGHSRQRIRPLSQQGVTEHEN